MTTREHIKRRARLALGTAIAALIGVAVSLSSGTWRTGT